jgi:hypothetical protein
LVFFFFWGLPFHSFLPFFIGGRGGGGGLLLPGRADTVPGRRKSPDTPRAVLYCQRGGSLGGRRVRSSLLRRGATRAIQCRAASQRRERRALVPVLAARSLLLPVACSPGCCTVCHVRAAAG